MRLSRSKPNNPHWRATSEVLMQGGTAFLFVRVDSYTDYLKFTLSVAAMILISFSYMILVAVLVQLTAVLAYFGSQLPALNLAAFEWWVL